MAGLVRHLVQRGDGFWARLVVPKELRPILGKTELRAPLGSNRKIAERDVHAAIAGFQDVLSKARSQLQSAVILDFKPVARPRPLTKAQLAHTHYAEELALDEAERNSDDTLHMAWARKGYADVLRKAASGRATDDEMRAAIGWAIDKFVERKNVSVKDGTAEWRGLARMLAQVQVEAVEAAIARDDGCEPSMPRLPILAEPPTPIPFVVRQSGPAVPILDLLDGYLAKLKIQGKGAEADRRWRPVFKGLIRYLGHDDARHLSKTDIANWRDHLLTIDGLSAKTVRDVHLASLRTILNWAVDEDKLTDNAAARVRLHVARRVRIREQGFTDLEALAILKASDSYQPQYAQSPATRESSYVTNAKRWLPWLCALTGARVAEMAQLRGQDVRRREEVVFLRITPEAGSVKTGQFRDVPLHPQLIERGFLDFVKGVGDGPLFFDATKTRRGTQHPSKIVANRVSRWVRGLELAPAEVDPSHGWRHRFKTVGREVEISDRILDALQGHASRTAGDDYGDVTLRVLERALRKMPFYRI